MSRRAPRHVLLLLLGAFVAGALAAPARADESEEVFLDRDVGQAEAGRVRARVLSTPAGVRQGGYGYVTVELRNPQESAHTVGIALYPTWGAGYGERAGWGVRRRQRLAAGETATLHLPLVNLRGGVQVFFSLDGGRVERSSTVSGGSARLGQGLAALVVGSGAGDWASYLQTQVGRVVPRLIRAAPTVQVRTPEQLPDQWALLSGFDLVVVDAGQSRLTPAREDLLVRYVAGGGNLAVFGLPRTADGPLAGLRLGPEVLEASEGQATSTVGHHGLGRFFATASADRTSSLDAWLTDSANASGVAYAAQHMYASGLPTPFWLPLEIPGLGEVPVQLFFFLLLAYALVVGPISYLYFKRRKRLPMLLVTIPALGFACTAIILIYGFVSEGFGIVAAERSFTVLDQRAHTAASVMGRTLYAGLQPAVLTPAPDAFFHSGSFVVEGFDRDATARFHADLDEGYRIDGGALPSRTPMPVITASVGRSRERLRFRRREDGAFEVLSAPGLVPVLAAGALLLRTADGALYRMTAGGALAPQADPGGAAALAELVAPLVGLPLGAGVLADEDPWAYRYGGSSRLRRTREAVWLLASGPDALGTWLAGRLPDGLPPGSYLARVRQPPQPDDLGLDLEVRAAEHVVLGYLAEQDVIDD